jgi:alpha-tubulin suppressor-like RCC1 family protein
MHPIHSRSVRRACALAAVPVLFGVACDRGPGPAGPTPPSSALRYTHLSAGYYHTCGLTASGTAYCWGGNSFGTLGDGTLADRILPTPVTGGRAFEALDAGAGHNCALTAAGAAWCWGQNDEGQAGDGTFAARSQPVAVTGGHVFREISAGHAHSCGLTADGTAWCWGDDSQGQLGDGGQSPTEKSAVPVRVQFDQPFAVIHAGYYQTCGVTSTAQAYCWGQNGAGQNGDDSTIARHVPVAVAGGHAFSSLAPGDRFVCGVSSDDVWCWGVNRYGELGASAPDTSRIPFRIVEAPSQHAVFTSMGTSTAATAEAYGCGLDSSGRVSCWGGAVRGIRTRGGISRLDDRVRAASVTAGAQHICALSRDGFAYCGGANYAGQIGDGTRTDRSLLTAVTGPET